MNVYLNLSVIDLTGRISFQNKKVPIFTFFLSKTINKVKKIKIRMDWVLEVATKSHNGM